MEDLLEVEFILMSNHLKKPKIKSNNYNMNRITKFPKFSIMCHIY